METTSEPERARLTARVSRSVHDVIEQAALWRGVSVNSFVVQAAMKAAEEVIEHERVIRLSQQAAHKLADLLDDPPEPNSALRKAAQRRRQVLDS